MFVSSRLTWTPPTRVSPAIPGLVRTAAPPASCAVGSSIDHPFRIPSSNSSHPSTLSLEAQNRSASKPYAAATSAGINNAAPKRVTIFAVKVMGEVSIPHGVGGHITADVAARALCPLGELPSSAQTDRR